MREMGYKFFISYSGQADQVIALRLQTLAAVYGFTSCVPSAQSRQAGGALLSAEIHQAIAGRDLFLAVVTQAPSAAAIAEVEFARSLNKLIIPIVGPFVDHGFLKAFPTAFFIDPANPGQVEADVVTYLQKSHTEKIDSNVLVGLAALTVGLLLLTASE